jgi:hypothetical protein
MITAKKLVARRGFEPRQTESKSVVLPLYYRAKQPQHRCRKRAKISFFRKGFTKKYRPEPGLFCCYQIEISFSFLNENILIMQQQMRVNIEL